MTTSAEGMWGSKEGKLLEEPVGGGIKTNDYEGFLKVFS